MGGCDSTPFCKVGVRTVTVAAQMPTVSDYYHTNNDTADRVSVEVFEKGFAVIVNTIKKIAASRAVAKVEIVPEASAEAVSEAEAKAAPEAPAAPETQAAPEAPATSEAEAEKTEE